jgi:regulator of sigma E protease
MTGPVAITLFVVALIAAIALHELGHFWTARRFGMRADRYFIGFGPTVWSTRRGETEYGVKAIPAGGFVRIRGMTPVDERLQPVIDTLVDRDAMAADRREQAQRAGVDVLEVPAVPDTTWERLDTILMERGASEDLRQRMVDRTRRNAGSDATAEEVARFLHEVIVTEVPDTGSVGDLHHRLVKGDEDRFFHDRPAWQRAIVLSAGSAMHFLIAVVALLGGLLFLAQPTGEPLPIVEIVQEESAAQAAGLQPGDRIVSVAGTATADFAEVRELIRQRPEQPTSIVVDRDGEQLTLTVTPSRAVDETTGEAFGLAGFVPRERTERMPVGQAFYETFIGPSSVPAMIWASLVGIVNVFGPEGLGQLFQQLTGQAERGFEGGMSIVGASQVAGQAVTAFGLMSLLLLIAAVNVFIGVFNMLPLPPLDGGHLAVLGWEQSVNRVRRLRGRPADYTVDARSIAAIMIPVLVIVGVVSLGLIWLDITNPIRLQ